MKSRVLIALFFIVIGLQTVSAQNNVQIAVQDLVIADKVTFKVSVTPDFDVNGLIIVVNVNGVTHYVVVDEVISAGETKTYDVVLDNVFASEAYDLIVKVYDGSLSTEYGSATFSLSSYKPQYTPYYPPPPPTPPPLPSLSEIPKEYVYLFGAAIITYLFVYSIIKRGERKRKKRAE